MQVHYFHPFQGCLTCRSLYLVSPLPATNIYQQLFLNLGPLDSSTAQTPLPCSCPTFSCSSCLICYPLPNLCNRGTDNAAKSPLCYPQMTHAQSRPIGQDSYSRRCSTSHHSSLFSYARSYITSPKLDLMLEFLQKETLACKSSVFKYFCIWRI